MAKKINHRGHGEHRELLFSLCPLCSLWFSEPISEDNKKSLRPERKVNNPERTKEDHANHFPANSGKAMLTAKIPRQHLKRELMKELALQLYREDIVSLANARRLAGFG